MSRLLLALCLALPACGGGSPTGPALGGSAWAGTYAVTDVSGGECVGEAARARVGAPPAFYLLGITVQGQTLNVAAVDTYDASPANYRGSVSGSSVSLKSLDPQPITPPVSTFHCSDAVARDVQFLSGTINASITGMVMSGTTTEIYTIKVSGTQTSVGNMTLASTFTATKQQE